MAFGFPVRMGLSAMNPRSNIRRALLGSELVHDAQCIYPRDLEIPVGGGVGTARAIAQAYSVFATGGKELAISGDPRDVALRRALYSSTPAARD